MKKYTINDSRLTDFDAFKLYRITLGLTLTIGSRFTISIYPDDYESQFIIKKMKDDLVKKGSIELKRNNYGQDVVSGELNNWLRWVLIAFSAPEYATAGDYCHFENLQVYRSHEDKPIYELFDYGRTQILQLNRPEYSELVKYLETAGIDAKLVLDELIDR